jgi:hypothetical protein
MPTKKTSTAPPMKDVTHPDASASSGSSRPIIVTNRPMIKDPMVVDESGEDNAKSKLSSKTSAPKVELESSVKPETKEPTEPKELVVPPKVEQPKETTLAKAEEPPKTEASVSPAQPEPEKPASEPETEKPPEAKPEKTPEPVKASDGVTTKEEEPKGKEQTSEDKQGSVEEKEAEAAAKQAEHEAAINKLVDSRHYNLPIVTSEQRHNRKAILLGIILILLMAVAWVDIALDAGLITIHGVQPLTHFFSR